MKGSFMPIYEYICKKCETKFEALVSRDSQVENCPHCGAKELKKCLSTFAAKVEKSPASTCANAENCPAAASHACNCACGCAHHH